MEPALHRTTENASVIQIERKRDISLSAVELNLTLIGDKDAKPVGS